MNTKKLNNTLVAALLGCSMLSSAVSAGIIKVDSGDFNAGAGLITFSEFALGTMNPSYTPLDYGGVGGDPDVNFDGWFSGQSLSGTPGVDCPGAAATACIVGSPTGPLSLDAASPDTFIASDGANPTSPVLSGTPTFNGGIAILFSTDQFGVGFDGGFFDSVASTAITAFARDGSLVGSVANTVTGIEFLGLVTDDNSASIAGVFLDLIGSEPAGFAIDNIRFGGIADINIDPIPEPATYLIMLLGLAGLSVSQKAKRM